MKTRPKQSSPRAIILVGPGQSEVSVIGDDVALFPTLRAFTVAEYEEMGRAGILGEDDRVSAR